MEKAHPYEVHIAWQSETGTTGYQAYRRDYAIKVDGKPDIAGSSDPSFRGNGLKYNPEELFLASIASCHMLWYLHLCAVNGIVVIDYQDHARAVMQESQTGAGRFKEVTLQPVVTLTDPAGADLATSLHKEANKFCFIANSLNFAVAHQARIIVSSK